MNSRVIIDVVDNIAHVSINRSEKLNALDKDTFTDLIKACDKIRENPSIRAAILSGEGRAFSAGLDLDNFKLMAGDNNLSSELIERTHGFANYVQHAALQWRALPIPVIAAVHGVAFGGGLQLALGADIRIVHPDTKLSIAEINWGLIPDMAGMLLLRDLVRHDIAAELIYTGRIFNGEEAMRIGLATHTNETPLEYAKSIAKTIAQKNPSAIRAAKRILSITDMEIAKRILLAESVEQVALIGSKNQTEAVNAALQKRLAVYSDDLGT